MVVIDLTRPSIERLADPSYHHPWLSMYPPSQSQWREAQVLRRRNEAGAKKALQEAAERKDKEEADAAAAAEKAEKETKEKAVKDAETAAVAAAAAARRVQHPMQTDLRFCYHECPGHEHLNVPIFNELLITAGSNQAEKKQPEIKSEKKTEKKTEKKSEPEDKKVDQKNASGKDECWEVKSAKEKLIKEGKEQLEKQPKGILKDIKQAKDMSAPQYQPYTPRYYHDYPWRYDRGYTPTYSSVPTFRQTSRSPSPERRVHFQDHDGFAPTSYTANRPALSDPEIPFEYLYRRPYGMIEPKTMTLTFGPDGKIYDADGHEIVVQMQAGAGVQFQARTASIGSNLVPSASNFEQPLQDITPIQAGQSIPMYRKPAPPRAEFAQQHRNGPSRSNARNSSPARGPSRRGRAPSTSQNPSRGAAGMLSPPLPGSADISKYFEASAEPANSFLFN